jgi:hypothetical protein
MTTRQVTAKVTVTGKSKMSDNQHTVTFSPDYQDGRNKEWALYTPALSLTMTVKEPVSDFFEQGKAYVLTFEVDEDANPAAGEDPGTVVR